MNAGRDCKTLAYQRRRHRVLLSAPGLVESSLWRHHLCPRYVAAISRERSAVSLVFSAFAVQSLLGQLSALN
jgi:hypothetical protein